MNNANFPFVIGYNAGVALLDKHLTEKCKGKSIEELVKMGQYKVAYCLALCQGNEEAMEYIATNYNQLSGAHYTAKNLNRLFGVFNIPNVVKTKKL